MVKKRMEDAKKSEFRVRKVKKHSVLKKDLVVSATVSSKTNYTVTYVLTYLVLAKTTENMGKVYSVNTLCLFF